MSHTVGLVIGAYLIGYIVLYGLIFAYMQGKYANIAEEDHSNDLSLALSLGVFSWVGVIIFIILSDLKYGLKFK